MRALQKLIAIFTLNLFPLCVFSSIIVIYVANDRIILTSDGREVITENGIDINSRDSFCKIRIINNYAIAIAGTIEGKGPIRYSAWEIVENAFIKYSHNEAIINITNELEKILPRVGADLGKTDERYKNATLDKSPVILSIAIVSKDSMKVDMIHFGYSVFDGESNINVFRMVDRSRSGVVNYHPLGVELTPSQKTYIENHVDLNNYESMDRVISLISKDNSRLVGGNFSILEVSTNGFKWIPDNPCH
ncbi:MAG: hypothetical protein IPF70_19025 [Saprospiraceae bacterium]|nr:hypothetical protein [Saprospiraceae bacterium]